MGQQNTIAIIENCRYCLMCRHVCPVGHVTRKETMTPHGWGLTIASVQRGLLTWNPETVDVLYSCADCGTCRAFCVTDQALPDAIAATRAEVAGRGLAPAAALEIHQAIQEWSNPYEKKKPDVAKGKGEVALFVGDDAKYLWPEGLDAALKLLAAVGVKPILIGTGRCNGYLPSSLGFPDTARELAQATLSELKASGAKRLLVLTPGDQYAFSRLLTERLGIEWPEGVELREVISLLEEKSAEGRLKFKPRLTSGHTRILTPPIHCEFQRAIPRRAICWRASCPALGGSYSGARSAATRAGTARFNSPARIFPLTWPIRAWRMRNRQAHR